LAIHTKEEKEVDCRMKNETVEQRIKRDFGMGFLLFAQQCKDKGLDAIEVAEKVGCSLSNLRRIARKFDFSFFVIEREPRLIDAVKFKNKKMNTSNFLSRRWVS
jgi:hypothetical protein